ncbi:MAG: hypothetical protein AAF213_12320 [Pseudomonadota bacterium]
MADILKSIITHRHRPGGRYGWVLAGVTALAVSVPTLVAAQQAYNPYRGTMQTQTMQTQAAPRLPVATNLGNVTPVGARINGIAEITRAGVLRVQGRDLRLHGVIIPLEMAAQSRASGDLIRLTKGTPVQCVTVGTDTDGMTLAACGTEVIPNLALTLIDSGRALVDRQQVAGTPVADLYLDAERQARRADLGLWGNQSGGPIPVHTAGFNRRTPPRDLSPPAPKPLDAAAINYSDGPVIRFDDGSVVDLSNPVPVASLAPDTIATPASADRVSFITSDIPATAGVTASVASATNEVQDVQFHTFGLRDRANQPDQVASLDAAIDLPSNLPEFGQPSLPATLPNDSLLLGLIGHLDDVIQRHRAAQERGELYIPTPPGEAPRTIPMPVAEQPGVTMSPLLWVGLASLLLAALGLFLYYWYTGIWPWERKTRAQDSQQEWADRNRSARQLAMALDQETLNLSFALAERADIARLASNKPSGHTASDLRALRFDLPNLISEHWQEVGRFSRSIGLQARMLHTQLAEFDRRVADMAALATEGRLHEKNTDVFAALAVRLDELAVLSRSVHNGLRQRLKKRRRAQPSGPQTTRRVATQNQPPRQNPAKRRSAAMAQTSSRAAKPKLASRPPNWASAAQG